MNNAIHVLPGVVGSAVGAGVVEFLHSSSHCCLLRKRLRLPPQPPYWNSSHSPGDTVVVVARHTVEARTRGHRLVAVLYTHTHTHSGGYSRYKHQRSEVNTCIKMCSYRAYYP